MSEPLGMSLPIVGDRVDAVMVDSEGTTIIFSSGLILNISGWTIDWEGFRAPATSSACFACSARIPPRHSRFENLCPTCGGKYERVGKDG